MRAVLDTNVLIRALINPEGTWGELVPHRDAYTHVMSPDLADELLTVVARRRMRRWLGGAAGQQEAIDRVLDIIADAEIVVPRSLPRVCRDQDDDMFFACAVSGNADYIVSEDEDILAIAEYEGVRTIRAAEFIRLLGG